MNANDKWKKENTVQVPLRFNRKTDPEIVEWIEKLKAEDIPVSGEIKKILKEYLKVAPCI